MPRIRTAPPVVALALGLLLTGCAGEDGATRSEPDQDRDRPSTGTATPPDRSSEGPTDGPRDDATGDGRSRTREPATTPGNERTIAPTTAPRPRGNALSVRTTGPDGHLIGAGDLGGRWRAGEARDEGARALSPCHRGTMADTGASTTRLREFEGPGSAVQAVSRFVDRKSAWRIERVVASWAEDCAADLRRRDAALGAVRHGRWLSVVEVAGVAAPRQQLARALTAVDATF